MLIEVFYVPGCPNHQPAVRRLRKVLRLQAVNVSVHEIPVTDDLAARALRFPGSPTVRIDGVDAEPVEQQPFGLTCRLYSGSDRVPSEEILQRSISIAKERRENAGRNQRTS